MKNTLTVVVFFFLVILPLPALSETPDDQKGAVIYLDNFLGNPNMMIVADLISMKHGQLKFKMGETEYNYSGNYSIYLKTPRHHSNPYFGLGSTDTAKLIHLENFFKGNGDGEVWLKDATVWEKSDGFIVAVAMGHEWILSGNYTIQN